MVELRRFRFVFLVGFFLTVTSGVRAQSDGQMPIRNESAVRLADETEQPRTRTELLNELSLRAAQVDLESAREAHERYKSEYENSQRLFAQSIISKKELDVALSDYAQAQQRLKQAEIQLERTKLSFLANATHITIMEAKKYYDSQGRRMLDLVLRNASNLTQAESALGLRKDKIESASSWQNPEQIRALLNIENIIVSIVSNSSSIGKPYEEIIPVLPYGDQKKVAFELLTDVQEAGVKLSYLDQTVTERIYLEKESLQQIPTVIASQFSQEGQLGATIRYSLDLEMLVTSDTGFSLTVTNLPPQINYSFVESRSGARITSVRFTEQVSKHELALELSIPQKLDMQIIDKPIDFQAWVLSPGQIETLNDLRRDHSGQTISKEQLEQIQAGRVDLTLVPKGAGRLEILIVNLYQEIKPGQGVDVKADLRNDGTLTLFNIVPEMSPPLGWTGEVEPKSIQQLLPGEKQSIMVHLQPGPDVGVGEFETLIEAKGQSGSEVIEALEKRLKVRISAQTNIATTLGLVVGLVVLITGIVFIGVKLSRR